MSERTAPADVPAPGRASPRRLPSVVEVDATGLSRTAAHTHPLWWGVLFVVVIEGTVVTTLLVSYFYLRALASEWPPAGIDPPPLLWPTVILFLLPISSYTMWWAGRGIARNDIRVLTLGTGLSVAIAGLVLVIRSFQIAAFDFEWDDSAYASMVWVITGFHYTHVASALVGTAVVTVLSILGFYTPNRQVSVVVDTLYWYFVAAVFLPIYLVLYWVPRLS